jgi:hypothetical protein
VTIELLKVSLSRIFDSLWAKKDEEYLVAQLTLAEKRIAAGPPFESARYASVLLGVNLARYGGLAVILFLAAFLLFSLGCSGIRCGLPPSMMRVLMHFFWRNEALTRKK